MPVRDPWGRSVGTVTRILDGSGPKYASQGPVRSVPFGLEVVKKSAHKLGYCLVTEGPIDTISAVMAGQPCVGCLGSRITHKQALLVSLYVPKIITAFDADDAGRSGAREAAGLLRTMGVSVIEATLPKDIGDLGDLWKKAQDPKRYLGEWVDECLSRI